jgi:hypothetical protein
MDVRPRHVALLAGMAIVIVIALRALIETAGKGVAVTVLVAALAALVVSYVWTAVLTMRLIGREDAKARLLRRGRAHILMMLGMPLVLIAAHPWGLATFAIGGGILVVCQVILSHGMVVAAFILRRRAGATPPP